MTCEPNKHNFKMEPLQTVTRAVPESEINTVTMYLQHCTLCGKYNEICNNENYEYINIENP